MTSQTTPGGRPVNPGGLPLKPSSTVSGPSKNVVYHTRNGDTFNDPNHVPVFRSVFVVPIDKVPGLGVRNTDQS